MSFLLFPSSTKEKRLRPQLRCIRMQTTYQPANEMLAPYQSGRISTSSRINNGPHSVINLINGADDDAKRFRGHYQRTTNNAIQNDEDFARQIQGMQWYEFCKYIAGRNDPMSLNQRSYFQRALSR